MMGCSLAASFRLEALTGVRGRHSLFLGPVGQPGSQCGQGVAFLMDTSGWHPRVVAMDLLNWGRNLETGKKANIGREKQMTLATTVRGTSGVPKLDLPFILLCHEETPGSLAYCFSITPDR